MLRKNVASQVLTFNAVNATTGAALTGATITTKATLDGTQSAGAGTVTELGTGQYKYVPTQGETNGTSAGFSFTATNMVPVNLHCFTLAADPTDAVRFGLTALPNAAVSGVGGLLTAPTTANVGLADLSRILGTALTETAGLLAGGFKKFFNVASPVLTCLGIDQTGDNFARLGAPAGASVSADIAAAKVDTAAIKVQTDKLTFTVANQVDSNVLDWKSATAPAMTGDAFARLGAPAGASVSADVAAVKVDTAATLAAVDTEVAAILAAVDTEVAAILALLNNARGEPAQGAPPVNPNLATKIDYVYKSWRNLKTNDGTTTKLFADDGTTVDHKQTTSEAAGTVSKAEWVSGP